jgi:hypothetical protein
MGIFLQESLFVVSVVVGLGGRFGEAIKRIKHIDVRYTAVTTNINTKARSA